MTVVYKPIKHTQHPQRVSGVLRNCAYVRTSPIHPFRNGHRSVVLRNRIHDFLHLIWHKISRNVGQMSPLCLSSTSSFTKQRRRRPSFSSLGAFRERDVSFPFVNQRKPETFLLSYEKRPLNLMWPYPEERARGMMIAIRFEDEVGFLGR